MSLNIKKDKNLPDILEKSKMQKTGKNEHLEIIKFQSNCKNVEAEEAEDDYLKNNHLKQNYMQTIKQDNFKKNDEKSNIRGEKEIIIIREETNDSLLKENLVKKNFKIPELREKNSDEINDNKKIQAINEQNIKFNKSINTLKNSSDIKEITEKLIPQSIYNMKYEKKSIKNDDNQNQSIKKDRNLLDFIKKSSSNYVIVNKISFYIPKKKIIRITKKVEGFYIKGIEENLEEDKLFYLSKIHPKGIENIGGTCYMNSTLQCFFHIKELTDYFLKNKKKIQQKNGLISTGLLDLIEGLSKNTNEPYTPIKFKTNLIKEDFSFQGSEGKDSGDLTLLILNKCHEELIDDYSDLQDMSLDQRKESALFLDIYLKSQIESSIIQELFSFYKRIKNICFGCGAIFYSLSLDNILVFSLEQVFRMNGLDITIRKDKRRVSIENCLSSFSFNNSFEKKEFVCKYCKKNSFLFSVKSFATLPKYLIMIMKRGKNEKFECQVDFEENIDLKDSYINVEGAPKDEKTKYTLAGGTILYGKGGYGHTVAFCRHFDDKYYIFNDSSFRKTCFNEIKDKKIYLLFYKKNQD